MDDIHALTAIDKWYLHKLKGMLDIEQELTVSKRWAADLFCLVVWSL